MCIFSSGKYGKYKFPEQILIGGKSTLSFSNRFLFGFLIVIFLLRLTTLGLYPLMDTTESRYADVGRMMLTGNDWITPRYPAHPDHPRGEPYLGKPPLSFWMTAFSFKVLGVSEFAARLPSMLNTILTILVVFCFTRKFSDSRTAYFAAIILATTGLTYIMSGVVSTDISLTMTVTLSASSFFLALNAENKMRARLWGYAFFAGLGLSLLAKGPLGVVLTFIPLVLWTLIFKEFRKVIFGIPWISGSILTVLIALPWYMLMERANPGYLKYFILDEHFYKYLKPDWKGDLYGNPHPQPIGTIWLYLLADTMPWLLALLVAAYYAFKKMLHPEKFFSRSLLAYLILWLLAPALFFTLCKNIQLTYMLYGVPAFAILMALIVNVALREGENIKSFNVFKRVPLSIFACTVPFAYTVISFAVLPRIAAKNSQKSVISFIKQHDNSAGTEIVYIRDRVPFSASFYSDGKARNIIGLKEEFKELFSSPVSRYVVVHDQNEYSKKLSQTPEKTSKIGEVDSYCIFKTIPPSVPAIKN